MSGCVVHEDEHLLVVNKPAGWNTHAPAPDAGEGIYDWLRSREKRWADLSILHRLDKDTSGILVFGKSTLANQSLTAQFATRQIRKSYLLLTDRQPPSAAIVIRSRLRRVRDARASHTDGVEAETCFEPISLSSEISKPVRSHLLRALPRTGRTHQIRVHASENGFPILGDTLYGGTPAPRLYLHAEELEFLHPESQKAVCYRVSADFLSDSRGELRRAVVEPAATDAFRLVHGASDGWPGWYVDRLGSWLLSQSSFAPSRDQETELARLSAEFGARGVYHKILSRQVRQTCGSQASPQLAFGECAPARWPVLENNLRYHMSFQEGYSVGLFLDQRDNRRRMATGWVGHNFPSLPGMGARLLNCFAYTCGFSVAGAAAGMRATSLDLSKKYLDWGRANFELNHIDPASHDFIYGDVPDWLGRFKKKNRQFEVIVLDPPTFSQSRQSGAFRVEKDLGNLVGEALHLLSRRGFLLVCANAADWAPSAFLDLVQTAVARQGRKLLHQYYVPQPPDFPISRHEPSHLKTVWLQVD